MLFPFKFVFLVPFPRITFLLCMVRFPSMFQLQLEWLITLRAKQMWHHASALYIALGRFSEECGNSNVSLQ